MRRIRLATAAAAALLLGAPSLNAVQVATVGDTQLNIYGWVWVYGHYYADATEEQNGYAGSLFYNYTSNPTSALPTDTHLLPDKQIVMGAQPTRFGFLSSTPSANLGPVTTQIEYDINGSNSNLRQANIKVGNWTFGRSWTLFGDRDCWMETADWCGPVGLPSWLQPRPYVVQYLRKIDSKQFWGVSLEQQTTTNAGAVYLDGNTPKAGTASMRYPSLVAGYTYKDTWGHIAVRGLGQYYAAFSPATASVGKKNYGKMEYAWLASGDIRLSKADDFLWSFYQGDALGCYGTGYQSVVFNHADQSVKAFRSLGWAAGVSHTWSPKYRSNVYVGGLQYKDPGLTGTGAYYYYLKSGFSLFANTFIFFNPYVDMGIEYGMEQARAAGLNVARDSNDNVTNHNTNRKINISLRARF
jgi:hypothetical protein